jgi:hypothetical protein
MRGILTYLILMILIFAIFSVMTQAQASKKSSSRGKDPAFQDTIKDMVLPKLKLSDGEMYYSGNGKLNQCDSVKLEFILSADKKEIKDITITLINIKIVVKDDIYV